MRRASAGQGGQFGPSGRVVRGAPLPPRPSLAQACAKLRTCDKTRYGKSGLLQMCGSAAKVATSAAARAQQQGPRRGWLEKKAAAAGGPAAYERQLPPPRSPADGVRRIDTRRSTLTAADAADRMRACLYPPTSAGITDRKRRRRTRFWRLCTLAAAMPASKATPLMPVDAERTPEAMTTRCTTIQGGVRRQLMVGGPEAGGLRCGWAR